MACRPICCCGKCLWERGLPHGYGSFPDCMSDFPNGTITAAIVSSFINIWADRWRIGATAFPGDTVSWNAGTLAISGKNGPSSIGATFVGTKFPQKAGIDLPHAQETEDRKLIKENINFDEPYYSPAIQGANEVIIEFDASHSGFLGGGNVGGADSGGFIRLPGFEMKAFGANGTMPDDHWQFPWTTGSNYESGIGLKLRYLIDGLSKGGLLSGGQQTQTIIKAYRNDVFINSVTFDHFWKGDNFNMSIQRGTLAPLNEGDISLGVDNLSIMVQGGETNTGKIFTFDSKKSHWTGGTGPTWDTTGMDESALLAGRCSETTSGVIDLVVGAKAQAVDVVPNRLYRIELELPATVAVQNGNGTWQPATAPDVPMLVVNDRSVCLTRNPEDLTNEYSATSRVNRPEQRRPPHHGERFGYYWRAESEKLTLGLIADPETSGSLVSVKLFEVAPTFRIDYPFRVGTTSGDVNWKLSRANAPETITPTINGGTAPILFELEASVAGDGLPATAVLNSSTGAITFDSLVPTPDSNMFRIKATDAIGRISYSYRLKWQSVA